MSKKTHAPSAYHPYPPPTPCHNWIDVRTCRLTSNPPSPSLHCYIATSPPSWTGWTPPCPASFSTRRRPRTWWHANQTQKTHSKAKYSHVKNSFKSDTDMLLNPKNSSHSIASPLLLLGRVGILPCVIQYTQAATNRFCERYDMSSASSSIDWCCKRLQRSLNIAWKCHWRGWWGIL